MADCLPGMRVVFEDDLPRLSAPRGTLATVVCLAWDTICVEMEDGRRMNFYPSRFSLAPDQMQLDLKDAIEELKQEETASWLDEMAMYAPAGTPGRDSAYRARYYRHQIKRLAEDLDEYLQAYGRNWHVAREAWRTR